MGIVMHKLIQIGEYCDCLQDWKKYEIADQVQSQSNLFMSQNDSNLQDPIEKLFQHEKIDPVLDKQLQIMHQKLKQRKKLKAQYLNIKEKQLKAKSLLEQTKDQFKRQHISNLRKLCLQQEINQIKDNQLQKPLKQKKQNKIRSNQRKKLIKEKTLSKHDLLQVQIQNNTFQTNDQHAKKGKITQFQNLPQKYTRQKEKESKKKKKRKPELSQSFSSKKSSGQSIDQNYSNIFEQPKYQKEKQQYIPQKDRLQYHEEQVSDLDSALFSHRQHKKTNQIQIIDLEKLNQKELRDEVSQMVIKKLRDRLDRQPNSQTLPLYPAIHSHRISNLKNSDTRNRQLRFVGQDSHFEPDAVEFEDLAKRSSIIEQQSNNYFLDQNDKEEYLKKNIR